MNAKQSTIAPLFVRLPTALIRRVRTSAKGKDVSMAVEVNRLLGEQLAHESKADIRRPMDDPLVMIYKSQLRLLEDFILRWVIPEDPTDATRKIHLLQSSVKELRRSREASVIETKRLLKERGAALATPASKPNPFSALLGDTKEDDSQHDITERRRLNLREEISKRPRGTKSMLAKAMGWTSPQLSQLISEPSKKCHRTISDDVARKIERELSLEPMELDRIESRPHMVSLQKSVARLAATAKKLRQ